MVSGQLSSGCSPRNGSTETLIPAIAKTGSALTVWPDQWSTDGRPCQMCSALGVCFL